MTTYSFNDLDTIIYGSIIIFISFHVNVRPGWYVSRGKEKNFRTSTQTSRESRLQFFLNWVMLLLLRLTISIANVHNVMNNILNKDIPGYDSCAGIIHKLTVNITISCFFKITDYYFYLVHTNLHYGLQPYPY